VIAELQQMKDALLAGDDCGLQNTWDEICVQLQDQHSYCWDAYEETVIDVIARHVRSLERHEQIAIWLQTDAGWDWGNDEPKDRAPLSWSEDEVVEHLLHRVFEQGGDWSNHRIRTFLERRYELD
jgi:hypothetical protein